MPFVGREVSTVPSSVVGGTVIANRHHHQHYCNLRLVRSAAHHPRFTSGQHRYHRLSFHWLPPATSIAKACECGSCQSCPNQ